MAKDSIHSDQETDQLFAEEKPLPLDEDLDDHAYIADIACVYKLWWNWANFELTVLSPVLPEISPVIIQPELLPNSQELEFVYPIQDTGNKFSTSKAQTMFESGMSMCKLYLTIEKIIYILIERIKQEGITAETEVQIAFDGFEFAKRKAFESVINLNYNVVVTNFDPGVWGERYLQTVKRLAERGYGYPPEAPRLNFRATSSSPGAKR